MQQRVVVTLLAVASSSLYAGGFSDLSKRAGTWEAGFIVNQVDSWNVNGSGGSSLDVDSDTGWGFTIGYHFSERLSLAFDFTHNKQPYDAAIVDASAPNNVIAIDHELDNDNYNFSLTYNFLERAFTPFISAGLGWSYLDSNVSTGDAGLVCWYDAWWGYVCDSYYSTYSDESFTYTLGAGLRWDLTNTFALRASINQRFIDLDDVSESPDISVGKLEFVWRM